METGDNDIVIAILGGDKMPDEGADPGNNGGGNGSENNNGGGNNGGGHEEFTPYKDDAGEYHFGKVFGKDYDQPEKIKTALSRASAYTPDIERELTELRSYRTDAETRIAEMSKKPVYKNPTLYKLDRVFEEDPNSYPLIQSFALGKLSDIDLIKADYRTRYPELAEKEDDLQIMIENDYGALFDEGADTESKEYKLAAMKLKMRATDLRKEIQGKLDKIEVPDPEKISLARKEQLNQLVTAWKAPFANIQKEFTKVPIMVPDEKDPQKEVELLSIDVPEAEREQYYKLALNHITSNGLKPENGGAETIAGLIRKMYVINNLPKIIAKVADTAATSANGKWRERIHNPNRREAKPGEHQSIAGDVSDALFEKLKSDGQV